MGSALKKTAHAAEQERPDVAARRLAWLPTRSRSPPTGIDETGASTKMARLRGRSKRGQRCRAAAIGRQLPSPPLRRDGLTAPMLLDGPMNGVAFLAYVEQVLVPTLVPGEVIMELACSQGLRRQTGNRGGGRDVCSCRLIRPTSIPSNKPSPNSTCSERPPLASMTYGMPSRDIELLSRDEP